MLSTGRVMPVPQRGSDKAGQAQNTWHVSVLSTLGFVYCFISKTKCWALLCRLRAKLDGVDSPAHMERTVSQTAAALLSCLSAGRMQCKFPSADLSAVLQGPEELPPEDAPLLSEAETQ